MRSPIKHRSNSMKMMAQTSFKQQKNIKRTRVISRSTSKLKDMKTIYDNRIISSANTTHQSEKPKESTQIIMQIDTDNQDKQFQTMTNHLCQQFCLHMSTFAGLYKQNHRKKIILTKMYGWDQLFLDIIFIKDKDDLRHDVTPAFVHQKCGFGVRSFKSKNTYNKMKLFLHQLMNNNKKQHDLEGKFMKIRLTHQLDKLDREMYEIMKKKDKSNLHDYVDQITKTHQLMLSSKFKVHNKMDSISQIIAKTGKVSINEFYVKQEDNINDIQKFFTHNRLSRHQ